MKKLAPYLAVTLLLVLPLVASAQIKRGAKSEQEVASFLETVANWLYVIGIALAIVIVIIGAIMYMTAGGDDEKVSKAKKFIITGLVGAVIIVLAGVLLDTVVGLIESAL